MAKTNEHDVKNFSSEKDLPGAATPSKRGLAAMGSDERREIASKGGIAVHLKGTGHKFTSEEARLAGQKGGRVASGNRKQMADLGRKGGPSTSKQNTSERLRVANKDGVA